MPKFPRKELEIQELVHRMIQGYTDDPAIFPNADIPGLQALLTAYETANNDQEAKQAVFHLATDVKDVALHAMEVKMRDQLKQSEVDVAANKEALELIGWGPRATPAPTVPPGQVRVLQIVSEGPGTLKLDWKAPDPATGGPVRTYKMERREEPAAGQPMGAWHEAGLAFVTEAFLSGQPRGLQMEYQVIGLNNAGEGPASNIVAVVL